jgi:hypothetical protein
MTDDEVREEGWPVVSLLADACALIVFHGKAYRRSGEAPYTNRRRG